MTTADPLDSDPSGPKSQDAGATEPDTAASDPDHDGPDHDGPNHVGPDYDGDESGDDGMQELERPSADAADLEGGDGLDWAVGAALDDVHRLFTRLFDRRMAKLGLTRAQWRVLTFLFRRDGMTQSALADLLEMERAPLGRLLDRLEESGWVERRADPGDKRAKRVFRTGKIDPLLPTVKTDAHDVLSGALSGFDDAERRAVLGALSRMKANLQSMEQTGGVPDPEQRSAEAGGLLEGPVSAPRSSG